jgi:DNA-binding NarL/FixJ family response regulator
MVKLLVIEDHALVREGLVQTLMQLEAEGVEVSGVSDFEGAKVLLEQEGAFDLALLDLCLPGVDGLSCLKAFRRRYPEMPVVILSAFDDPQTVGRTMASGAAGFVSKAYSSARLLASVRDALAGKVTEPDVSAKKPYVSTPQSVITKGKAKKDPAAFGLSERQAQVLGLMTKGISNRDIAALLGLSEGTVKIHLTTVFKLLGVSSRTQAMLEVAKRGIRLE